MNRPESFIFIHQFMNKDFKRSVLLQTWGVEEHARGVDEPLVVGESRPPHFWSWGQDPPTALAVTAEGASCAARAVPSDSVSCMLAA